MLLPSPSASPSVSLFSDKKKVSEKCVTAVHKRKVMEERKGKEATTATNKTLNFTFAWSWKSELSWLEGTQTHTHTLPSKMLCRGFYWGEIWHWYKALQARINSSVSATRASSHETRRNPSSSSSPGSPIGRAIHPCQKLHAKGSKMNLLVEFRTQRKSSKNPEK